MLKKTILFLFLITTSLSAQRAFAFLENATHGYSNCLTCHYSPAGGDLLNDYGRSLSSEMMSTWSAPGVEGAFGGLIKESKWAKFGGDLRTVQSYMDTPAIEDRSLFLMQNNIEVGLKHKKLMFVGTVGTLEGPSGTPDHHSVISERHYVMAELSQTSRFRAGKFRVNYGLNDPNHNRFIKRGLGFGSYSETYNLEYSKFFENGDIFVNYSLGRIDLSRTARDERSLSVKLSHYLGGKAKVGVSALHGETIRGDRSLLGAFGVVPITDKSYVVYELDYEYQNPSRVGGSEGAKRIITHTRAGYEFFKGFKGYGIFDVRQNLADSDTRDLAPGFGFQWLPFPHFELQMEYQNIDKAVAGSEHFGFFVAHMYY